MAKAKSMKLFVWTISDTVVEYGIAFALAPTRKEAIEAICKDIIDEEMQEELRAELKKTEPEIETSQIYGYFSESPT